jgi:1,2-diacylglycerol 3-alpha-glucosyltransferase
MKLNILLFANAFIPKVDGIVNRIKTFLDVIDKKYPNINVTIVTPNTLSYYKYKRFDIIHLPGELLPTMFGGNEQNDIYITSLFKLYNSYKMLYDICITSNIDVIHIYQGDGSVGCLTNIGEKLSIPVIISWHTNVFKYLECYGLNRGIINMYKKILYLEGFYNADNYMTVSESCKQELIQDLHINKDINVIPYFIDTTIFYPITNNNVVNKFTILFVGRITKEKNIDEIINVCKRLSFPVKVLVCGDGVYIDELKEKTIDMDFEFLGTIEREKLYIYYNLADVLLNPSITETLGLTTLEAMACKLLVVGRRATGTQDIITDKFSGFLYNTIEELQNTIEFVFKKNNKRTIDEIIENAYSFVIQFSEEKYVDYLLTQYNNSIAIKKNNNISTIVLNKIYMMFILFLNFCNFISNSVSNFLYNLNII